MGKSSPKKKRSVSASLAGGDDESARGRLLSAATRLFVALFASQLAMYAFHESAEARLLPWSDVLHAATEPYGPDGLYGRHYSWLLLALPVATAVAMAARQRWPKRPLAARPARTRGFAVAMCVALVAIGGGLSLRSADTGGAAPPDTW